MHQDKFEKVAGNGLINRRYLLGLGLSGVGIAAASSVLGADSAL